MAGEGTGAAVREVELWDNQPLMVVYGMNYGYKPLWDEL